MTRYARVAGCLTRSKVFSAALVLAALPLQVYAQVKHPAPAPTPAETSPTPARQDPSADGSYVLVGAGDIASCKYPEGARATAKLIEKIPGTVFAAGDLAYERGTAAEFRNCYDTTWGKFKDRTRPT